MIAILNSVGTVVQTTDAPIEIVSLNIPAGGRYIEVSEGVKCGMRLNANNEVDNAYVDHEIEVAKAAVSAALSERTISPILYMGSAFDADKIARGRISAILARLLRGDGLPVGWLGWRDANNTMHWTNENAGIVLSHLRGIASAIEDREQALLISAWIHKAAIGSLQTVSELQAYDVSIGWGE